MASREEVAEARKMLQRKRKALSRIFSPKQMKLIDKLFDPELRQFCTDEEFAEGMNLFLTYKWQLTGEE